MANQEHVKVFERGATAVQQYSAAKGIQSLDLSGTEFTGLDHRRPYNLHRANLENSVFRDCSITLLPSHANLRGAIFSGGGINLISVNGSDLTGAEFYDVDLRSLTDLSQQQLDSTKVGVRVILNEYLTPPAHWLTDDENGVGPIRQNTTIEGSAKERLVGSEEERNPNAETTETNLSRRVVENRFAISSAAVTVRHLISVERERIRGRNDLSPEEKSESFQGLDRVDRLIVELQNALPPEGETPSDEQTAKIEAWTARFKRSLGESIEQYADPKNLANAAVPTAIILFCGGLGALVAGPLGFGAGSVVGNLITGQMKPGAAAKKIENSISAEPE